MSTALDDALAYADRGWYVFPVQPAPAKRPLNPNGFHGATTDPDQIEQWWTRWPDAQVGIACGASGFVAVDVDSKPEEGVDGWEAIRDHEPHACELVMKTPRGGGAQLFFADPDGRFRRRLGVLPGIDLLGAGGYTIVPSAASPARHWQAGDPFELEDLVPAPAWVVDLAGELPQGSAAKRSASAALPESAVLELETVADIRAGLLCIPNDDRGTWIKVGMALKSTGAGEQAYALWLEWSRRGPDGGVHPKFDAKDQRYQWDRLSVARADASEVGLPSLFWLAQEHGYEGNVPAVEESVQVGDRPAEEPTGGETAKPDIVVTDWQDVALLPPIRWQIDNYLPDRSIVLFAGDSEAGKSFLAIHLAMCMVHGMPWLGNRTRPGNVIYLAGEGHDGMAARFRAWRRRHQPEDQGRYCVVSSRVPVLKSTTMPKLEKLVADIEAWKQEPPDLIVIDTLSQGLEDDENDAKAVAPVIRGLMRLRERWGCTVVLVHHLVKLQTKGKNGAQRPTRDSIRGSSVLSRNVDTVLGLIVDGDHHASRVLEVWKQKDGEKPVPSRLWLQPVPTGELRETGDEEWSCTFHADACEGLYRLGWDGKQKEAPQTPFEGDRPADGPTGGENPHAVAAFKAAVETVVATVRALGAVEGPGCKGGVSGNAIVEAAGLKRTRALAAIRQAGLEGLLRNLGTEGSPAWVVPKPKEEGGSDGSA